jgi:hypothetical protein
MKLVVSIVGWVREEGIMIMIIKFVCISIQAKREKNRMEWNGRNSELFIILT